MDMKSLSIIKVAVVALAALLGTDVFGVNTVTPADDVVLETESIECNVFFPASEMMQSIPDFTRLADLSEVQPQVDVNQLPQTIYVGGQVQHVQGIAYDGKAGCMYMSFTSRFVKTDLNGNILASIDCIQGHLGAMTFDPVGRKVYASLECKDDEIGQGIAKTLNVAVVSTSVFYIAIIDVDKLTELGQNAENSDVIKTVCVREACDDYDAKIKVDGGEIEHRFACSGIDGVTIAPAIGSKEKSLSDAKKLYLYVAYGVYGKVDRTDNDYQVILKYDLASLEKYSRPVVFETIHSSGPKKPLAKYFIFTGNTNWGVQNLAYDENTGDFFMAVYKGKKPQYPNYDLYAFKMDQKPFKSALHGVPYFSGKVSQLVLDSALGLSDNVSGVSGWRFKWGSTGLNPLGNGLWYISENAKDKATGTQSCTARLYRWTGDSAMPFVPAGK